MYSKKTFLQEIAQDLPAIKVIRSLPVEQKSMNFIRSLINESPDSVTAIDKKDEITFDVPLLIRVFELVREDIKSDVELHELIERIIDLRTNGTLTMNDYSAIANRSTSSPRAGDPQDENLTSIKKLAGIK